VTDTGVKLMGPREPIDATHYIDGLPPRPDPDLDRVLDAAERCLTRFGLRRATMSDIAREMGVARTTLYRQVSSLEEATALVFSRRLHRFIDKLLEMSRSGLDAEALVSVIARSVRMTLAEPIMQRLLQDEPDLLGDMLTSGAVAGLVDQIINLMTPVLGAAMDAGLIRGSDPAMAASWIVRSVLVLTAVPVPDADLERQVRYALLPLFEV